MALRFAIIVLLLMIVSISALAVGSPGIRCEELAIDDPREMYFLSYKGSHYWITLFSDNFENTTLGLGSLGYPKFTDFQASEPLSERLACIVLRDADGKLIHHGILKSYLWRPDKAKLTLETINGIAVDIEESFVSPNVIVAKIVLENKNSDYKLLSLLVYTSGSGKAFEHIAVYEKEKDAVLYKQHAVYDHYWILKIKGLEKSYSHGIYKSYDLLFKDFGNKDSLNNRDKEESYSEALIGGLAYKFSLIEKLEFYIILAFSYEGWSSSFEYASKVLEDPNSALKSVTEILNEYLNSVPRFECSDSEIERMYYMSWFELWYNTYQPYGYWKYEVITPSKSWSPWPVGGYARGVWLWDSAFHAIALRYYDPEKAKDQIKEFIATQREDGKIHREIWIDQIWPREDSSNTQPPGILTITAYWLYLQTGDTEFLRECYNAFKKFDDWWYREQDLDRDGLCEWPSGGDSGLDNLPAWDLGAYIYDAVDLNCWLYLDQLTLAKMAEALGLKNEAEEWRIKAENTKRLINEKLYDYQSKTYANVMIKNARYPEGEGKFFNIRTIVDLWPLWAGVADKERAEILVTKYLANSREFWAPYPLRTVSKREGYPFYDVSPEGYWRGSVWIATNWLMIQGLYKYNYKDLATELSYKTLKLVAKNGVTRERYNPETGEATGAYVFMWSGALYIDIITRNIIGYDPTNDTLVLQPNLPGEIDYAALEFKHKYKTYRVFLNSTVFQLYKDNVLLFSLPSNSSIMVLDDDISDGDLKIKAKGKGFLIVHSLGKNREYEACINGKCLLLKSNDKGCLRIELNSYWSEIKITPHAKVANYNTYIFIIILLVVLIIGIYKLASRNKE